MTTSYRFGRVEVRPAERQIVVEGQTASVGARAFDVLMALIDRRDRVVTKDELLDIVWPGLVVEENNLQVQVSTLRKVLGARSVATIPGRGYRFTLEPEVPDAPMCDLSAPRHNLPAQLNRFIGREHEIGEVKSLLAESRLVTLASLGGTGKTRLSLQVAHELVNQFPDGAWFVELAPVPDPRRVPQAVAAVLGVGDTGSLSLIDALARWVQGRNILLVLDNCEHVLSGVADLAGALLRASPALHLLASSREPLRISGETVYPLSPLPIPDTRYAVSSSILEQYDAVRLFVDRASAANANFSFSDANAAAIAAICARLDGIPLAIELAAARVRALSVDNIASRLDDRFRLLTTGDQTAAPRQQTLRASLDWSYDLLSPPEATLLRRLAVFSGGWTLEAAETVCSGDDLDTGDVLDLLVRLVEKSLVDTDAFGERYRLLETVRQYGFQKLVESGDEPVVRQQHIAFYADLAQRARAAIAGPEYPAWLRRLDDELENVLAAHAASDPERGLRILSSIRHYCLCRGLGGLAHRLAAQTLARLPERNAARSQALSNAGQIGHFLGKYAEARIYLEESVSIAREVGDLAREALALQPLGMTCLALGLPEDARGYLGRALEMARDGGLDREICAAVTAFAQCYRIEGDDAAAAAMYEEAIECARRLDDKESIAIGLLNLAMAASSNPIKERALFVAEALSLALEIGSNFVRQSVMEVCAGLSALCGSWQECATFYGAAEALAARTALRRDAADEAFLAPLVEQARSGLGESAFAAAEAAGRALGDEKAVSRARAWLEKAASSRHTRH